MKNWFFFFLILTVSPVFAGDDAKDALNDRRFNVSLSETRNGVVQKKVHSDLIRFKDGKLRSEFIREKFGFGYIRYRITFDTSYVDETGTDVRLIKLVASATDEDNYTVHMELTSLEWDLDGVIRVTRNDRLRKYYDLAGREKGGKPKKQKQPDPGSDNI